MSEPLTYLLPIRSEGSEPSTELTRYLRWLAERATVLIVDGSPPSLFEAHRLAWGSFSIHVAPAPEFRCLNGKAWGVRTGMHVAQDEIVVVADDDVRYTERSLAAAVQALGDGDLLRPQNYFDPLPWHAAWDTGRTLLNRAFGNDHPGTLVIRRSTYLEFGDYDGDVLFENLELVRTLQANGGRVVDRPDIYVRRLPPSVGHFLSQRFRQAYDDLAQPSRFARHLAVVPGVVLMSRRPRLLLAAAGSVVATAELGRRRSGGSTVFAPGIQCTLARVAHGTSDLLVGRDVAPPHRCRLSLRRCHDRSLCEPSA